MAAWALGNQLNGGTMIQMLFDTPVTEITWQGWADGPSGLPRGGIFVLMFLDEIQVGFYNGDAAFGGLGDEWFNAVADAGDAFDEIVFLNPSLHSLNTYVDNITWNAVPSPGPLALLGVAGLLGGRRRRAGHP